jgi:hypothetical protein
VDIHFQILVYMDFQFLVAYMSQPQPLEYFQGPLLLLSHCRFCHWLTLLRVESLVDHLEVEYIVDHLEVV